MERLLLNTRVPGFIGRFFNCLGDESLGPVPFPAALLPGWRHQKWALPVSPNVAGKVILLPVPHMKLDRLQSRAETDTYPCTTTGE